MLLKKSNVGNSDKLPLWLRWWGLFNGALALIWLPREDVQAGFIVFLSVTWCGWLGGWLWVRYVQRGRMLFRGAAIGAVSGGLFFPVVVFLAVFKAGIHDHGFLDYSNFQLGALSSYVPWMLLIGGILGAAAGFWVEKRVKNPNSGQNV